MSIKKLIDIKAGLLYNYGMNTNLKSLFSQKVADFRLPRYEDLPNVGLYLEQTTEYINGYLAMIGCPLLTASMISNYVKSGIIAPPEKKKYYKDQLGYLIFIAFAKNVISMDNISSLIKFQQKEYDSKTAYEYFCDELLNMLSYICGLKDSVDNIGTTNTQVKTMFRSVIIASTHILFLINCFDK